MTFCLGLIGPSCHMKSTFTKMVCLSKQIDMCFVKNVLYHKMSQKCLGVVRDHFWRSLDHFSFISTKNRLTTKHTITIFILIPHSYPLLGAVIYIYIYIFSLLIPTSSCLAHESALGGRGAREGCTNIGIHLYNCPLKGIGVRDFYVFFRFVWVPGGFPLDADQHFERKLRI